MEENRSICVFCGSSPGDNPKYASLADATGRAIHSHGHSLVYGGGGSGLMGTVARATRNAGGHVLGIIPEFLMKAEHALEGVDREIVPDMHGRKQRMYEVGDAFIVLPGGIGTMEEAIEILCWQRLQLHQKPIVFLSDNHYWDPLLTFMDQTIQRGFSPDWLLENVINSKTAKAALKAIENAWAQPPKAIRPIGAASES